VCSSIRRVSNKLARQEELAGRPCPSKCEVCNRPPSGRGRLHWDHDHRTGGFRGWLCYRCNIALGFCEDNVEILRKLIAYLEKSRGAA